MSLVRSFVLATGASLLSASAVLVSPTPANADCATGATTVEVSVLTETSQDPLPDVAYELVGYDESVTLLVTDSEGEVAYLRFDRRGEQ